MSRTRARHAGLVRPNPVLAQQADALFIAPILPDGPRTTTPDAWKGTVDSTWQNTGNWSSGVPSGNSAVTLGNGTTTITYDGATSTIFSLNATTDSLAIDSGALSISNTATVATSLTINSGALSLANTSTIATLLIQNSGMLTVSAKTTTVATTTLDGGLIAGAGTFATTGGTNVTADGDSLALDIGNGAVWNNSGTVTDNGTIGLGLANGGNADATSVTINNSGTFNLALDGATLTNAYGTGGFKAVLNNSGLLQKTTGVLTQIGIAVNNTGTINVAAGATIELDIAGGLGGKLTGAGTLSLANSFAVGSLTGTGTVLVATGTLTGVAGKAATIGTGLVFNGGTIEGPGTVTTTGATTIVDGAAGQGVSGPISLAIGDSGVWTNNGLVADAGRIGFGAANGGNADSSSATLNNAGTFDFTTDDGAITNAYDVGGFVGVVNNSGTLAKIGGTGTSYLQVALDNTGSLVVSTGAMELDGGGTLGGTVSGAGTLILGGGNFVGLGLAASSAVLITGSGTLSLSAMQTGSIGGTGGLTFAQGGGIFLGAGGIETVSAPVTFNNGLIGGTGTFATTGATTVVDGQVGQGTAGPVSLDIGNGGVWTNSGVVTDAGRIGYGQGNGGNADASSGTINNSGTFNLSTDDGVIDNAYGVGGFVGVFNNSGVLAKSGGTGTSYVQVTLNSTGTISANTGTLELDNGGSLSGVIAGTGTVLLGGGSFAASALSVTGKLAVSGTGVLTESAHQSGTITGGGGSLSVISGGAVSADTGGTLTVAGAASFNGGLVEGPGLFASSGATTIVDGQVGQGTAGPVSLDIGDNGVWTNSGVVTDAGRIGFGESNGGNADATSGTINNSGTFNFSTDDGVIDNAYGAGGFVGVFNNSGLLAKTGGSGTSTVQETLNSTGTLSASTGTLELDNGGSLSGVVAGSATVLLGGGSFVAGALSVTGKLAIAGSGVLAENASQSSSISGTGSLNVNTGGAVSVGTGGTLTVAGPTIFNGGVVEGPGLFTTSGATTIVDGQAGQGTAGPVSFDIGDSGVWTNSGVVTDAGRIGYGAPNGGNADASNGTINNAGTFDFSTDDGVVGNAYGVGGFVGVFNNSGMLAKTGGTGTSYLQETFNSTGTIAASTGTLELDNGGTLGGTAAASKGTVLVGAAASFAASGLTVADNAAIAALTVAGTLTNATTLTLIGKLALTGSGQFSNAKAGTVLLTGADATIGGIGTSYSATNAGLIRDTFGGTAALAVTLANTGTIDAAAGVLKLANVSGAGKLTIEAGATLDIGNAVATTQAIGFAGAAGATLKQDKPVSVATAMMGFGAGDRIDLAGLTATAASISGSTLTVTAGGKSYTYSSTASLVGLTPSITSDGNGGSLVSLYRLATASVAPTTLAFGNLHVGGSETLTIGVTNTAPADGYSEAVDASLGALPGGLTNSGSLTGITAGNTGTIAVKLAGATAGSLAGTGTLALSSDGTGIDGGGTHALASQAIGITGGVFRLASAQIATTAINFGVVHVGDVVAQGVTITNGDAADGYSENLNASASASGSATATGSVSELGAGLSSTAIQVGLATSASGTFTGSVALGLISDGSTIDGLGTTALTGGTIAVSGTVDTFAVAAFEDPGGPAIMAGGAANSYTLNLGTLALGGAGETVNLGVLNSAMGLSDLLAGTISASGAGYTTSGFGSFSGLGAGQDEHGQSVTLSAATGGTFTETVTLAAHGTNASGYVGITQNETLVITGTVAAQGGTYTLALGPNTIVGASGPDVFIAAAGAINSRDNLTGSSGNSNLLQLTGGGVFDINAPKTFANIQTISATEGQAPSGSSADTRQILLLRDGSAETVNVASGTAAGGNANPETITIYGAVNSDIINLGAGSDVVYVGGAGETVNGGSGVDTFYSTGGVAGATINGGGKGVLHIDGGGTFTMGSSVTALAGVVLDAASGNTSLVANGIAGLGITGSGGADTITLGAASQTVNAAGGAVHVLATAAIAGAAITGANGAVLEITTGGGAVLNNADSNLIVRLDQAGTLSLGKGSFISATGSGGVDKITAGAAGQVLTGGLGADTLIGSTAFGDTFLDTSAGLNGDSITNFGGSDVIHVSDLVFGSLTESYSGNTTKGVLSLSDGTHSVAITLIGNYTNNNFTFATDNAGGTLIGHN